MDPTNANTALASAFVEELARCGVRQAVISPGSRSTPLALALWRRPEIEVTVIVDERSAGVLRPRRGAGERRRRSRLLCTSGTAAANYHPAICEADESAIPLLVLTRRPAAGAARDRRRPDDRPDQALRLGGALVLRSRHPRRRRRGPAALPLDRLPRLRRGARRDAARPRPPQPPLARAAGADPGRGRGDRHRPAGARGSRGPAADRGDARSTSSPRPFLLEEVAEAHRRRDRRRDRRRPPARPRAARAARPPRARRPASRSSPSRPPSCAAARTTARTSSPPTTCCCATSASPSGRARPGPALRRDADQQAAARLARGQRRRPDRRRPLRRLERADAGARRRCCAPTRPSWRPAGRRGVEPRASDAAPASGSRPRRRPRAGDRGRARRRRRRSPSPACTWRSGAPTATATSSTPPRACRSATRRPSSPPATPTCSSSATAAPTGSTA